MNNLKKILLVLFFSVLFIPNTAYARYCNNPYCAMCNRIFGPMRGYTIKNGRVYRTTTTTTRQTTPPVIQKPEPPVEPPVVEPEPPEPPVDPEPPTSTDKYPPDPPELLVDATFEPMPQAAVKPMLQQVWPLKNEILYDLGCGDGRIIIEAVDSFGCKAVGIEINPITAAVAKKNMEESGLGRMLVVKGNVRDYSLADASVITMYLFPDVMEEVIPNIKPGTRVVSFEHEIPGVDCTKKTVEVDGVTYTFYTWAKPRETIDYTNSTIIQRQSAPSKPFSLVK